MVKEREVVTIELDPESELAQALAGVDKKPIVLVSDGERFRESRAEQDAAADYDAEAVRAALRAAAGTITPEEGERLKRTIHPWRDEEGRRIDPPGGLATGDRR